MQVQNIMMPLFCLSFYSSPLNLLGSVRHSSSSLSSHTSSETGNLVILTDSSVGEAAEDMYHMQVQLQHSQERVLDTALNVLWRVMPRSSTLYLYTCWDLSCDAFLKERNKNLTLFKNDDGVIQLGLLWEEICICTVKVATVVQDHSIPFGK